MKTKDKVGKKFDRWTVLEMVEGGSHPKVRCRCDCGTEKILLAKTIGHSTKSSLSRSCGCYHRDRMKEVNFLGKDVAAINQYYSIYKTSAKQRKHTFELDKKEFSEFIFQNCYYCGKEPQPRLIYSKGSPINVNGIDRVDNDIGYTKSNSVTCCHECNDKKSTVTVNIMKRALAFLDGK